MSNLKEKTFPLIDFCNAFLQTDLFDEDSGVRFQLEEYKLEKLNLKEKEELENLLKKHFGFLKEMLEHELKEKV